MAGARGKRDALDAQNQSAPVRPFDQISNKFDRLTHKSHAAHSPAAWVGGNIDPLIVRAPEHPFARSSGPATFDRKPIFD